jgi:hypothetical protein
MFPTARARAVAWTGSIDSIIPTDKVYCDMAELKLNNLHCLAALAGTGHFGRAAAAYRVCQPVTAAQPRTRAAGFPRHLP